jgi:chemotaxis family two-component system sensor kinase Cph1
MMHTVVQPAFLGPDEPVDLDNCAREPIHRPGLVQPRGVLLALTEPGHVVLHASRNVDELLGVRVEDLLDHPLARAVGTEAAAAVAHHAQAFSDLRERNPLTVTIDAGSGAVAMDCVLHRLPVGPAAEVLLVVELEPAQGPRPFSFPNTYQAVKAAVAQLSGASTLRELYARAAVEVRTLTGFDRVMIYRFDADYNGEVVAESKREHLEAFLGLHYPASDIPVQARKLYESNWLRLISDVSYTPVPIVSARHGDAPLDLTHAMLRSVSPMHVEYLQNMGVHASMSISLMRDGRLWGLVACHHYQGPHTPPYGVRAAAEFLGAALSLRLADRAHEEDSLVALAARSTLAGLVEAINREHVPLGVSLLATPGLLELIPADGVLVHAEGRSSSRGRVPAGAALDGLLDRLRRMDHEVWATDALAADQGDDGLLPDVAGVLAVTLPEDQMVVWFRREVPRPTDWGGDPTTKQIVPEQGHRGGQAARMGPRTSFARWREVIRGRCAPWDVEQTTNARTLRRHLLEGLHERERRKRTAAETVQRSLLPRRLPELAGWDLRAGYQPALGGQVGGDWYDALLLPDGRLAVVVGDVAGHGLDAAGAMAQLRNALRAYLVEGATPAEAVQALDRLMAWLLPEHTATLVLALVDLGSGEVHLVCAGHLPPYLLQAGGDVSALEVPPALMLGVIPGAMSTATFTLAPGAGLVLFSDGIVERRDESIDEGLERLRTVLGSRDPDQRVDAALRSRDPLAEDDATLLVLHRDVHL